MTRSLAVTADNDLLLDAGGSLVVAVDIEAVKFAAAQTVKAIRGEMVFAADQGMPYFEALWNGSPNLLQVKAALRQRLLAVGGVVDVPELTASLRGDSFVYSATILTIYGAASLNG